MKKPSDAIAWLWNNTLGQWLLLAAAALAVLIWIWVSKFDLYNLLVIVGLVIAAGHLSIARRQDSSMKKGQYSDRLAKTVEQISSDQLMIRLGGLASMEALSKETEDEFKRVWQCLGHFLRYPPELAQWPNKQEQLGRRPDIAAVATMLRSHDKKHLRWIEENQLPLKYANLQGADLSSANLQNADLRNAKLQSATLINTNLQNANLISAKLQSANLIGAKLQSATLISTNLQDANLISANLQNADLRNVQLQSATLISANLQRSTLPDAKLQGADLQGAQLQGATLQDANLQDADLRSANLQGSTLIGANLQRTNLQDANLHDATLINANLQYADLRRVNLQGADLRNANLRSADLRKASLQERELQQLFSKDDGVLLKGALFSLDALKEALHIKSLMPEKMSEVYYDASDGPLPGNWPADHKPRRITNEEWQQKKKRSA